ncbi:hypothetical protein AAG906_019030 [Vitis piasezkii]
MEMLETEFATYACLGMLILCPSHSTRIVESRNAKFLEYDLVSGNDQFRNIVSDIDHIESQSSTSSDKLTNKFNQSLKTNQSLKFHKLLTTFQYMKLIRGCLTLLNNKLNLILP